MLRFVKTGLKVNYFFQQSKRQKTAKWPNHFISGKQFQKSQICLICLLKGQMATLVCVCVCRALNLHRMRNLCWWNIELMQFTQHHVYLVSSMLFLHKYIFNLSTDHFFSKMFSISWKIMRNHFKIISQYLALEYVT